MLRSLASIAAATRARRPKAFCLRDVVLALNNAGLHCQLNVTIFYRTEDIETRGHTKRGLVTCTLCTLLKYSGTVTILSGWPSRPCMRNLQSPAGCRAMRESVKTLLVLLIDQLRLTESHREEGSSSPVRDHKLGVAKNTVELPDLTRIEILDSHGRTAAAPAEASASAKSTA